MYPSQYNILIVDDEPDILTVTKLALKNVKIDGLPIALFTAGSKAEAIKLLQTRLRAAQNAPVIHVAFIDVVMETDHAGLELCEYIREDLGNTVASLYIRTGQPGIAPERSIVDRYKISGYATKVEMTESKLYSVTVAGARAAMYAAITQSTLQSLRQWIGAAQTREGLTQLQQVNARMLGLDALGNPLNTVDPHLMLTLDNELIVNEYGLSDEEATAHLQELIAQPGIALNNEGDRYVYGDRELLIHIAPGETHAEVAYLAKLPGGTLDRNLINAFHSLFQSLSILWNNAA